MKKKSQKFTYFLIKKSKNHFSMDFSRKNIFFIPIFYGNIFQFEIFFREVFRVFTKYNSFPNNTLEILTRDIVFTLFLIFKITNLVFTLL